MFKVGDRVRVVVGAEEAKYDHHYKKDSLGTVKKVNAVGEKYAVEMDELPTEFSDEESAFTHNCCGETKDDYGQYFSESQLELVKVFETPEYREALKRTFVGLEESLKKEDERLRQPADTVLKLRDQFPHGHTKFIDVSLAEMDLHNRKNHDYAGGGDPLGNFKRSTTILGLYPGLDLSDPAILAMVYAMKQIDAYFWLKCTKREGKVEGVIERLRDISVYAKLAQIIELEPKPKEADREYFE